jgi:hypothetical protein
MAGLSEPQQVHHRQHHAEFPITYDPPAPNNDFVIDVDMTITYPQTRVLPAPTPPPAYSSVQTTARTIPARGTPRTREV